MPSFEGDGVVISSCRALRHASARRWNTQPAHRAPVCPPRLSVTAPCRALRHASARRWNTQPVHKVLVTVSVLGTRSASKPPTKPWLQLTLQQYSTRSDAYSPPSAV